MQLRQKILIDRIAGIPGVLLLGSVSWLKRKISGNTVKGMPKRISVCKLVGMGSIIQATPLLQSLRQQYPEAELTFISSARNSEILRLFPMIDKSVTIDDSSLPGLITSVVRFLKHSIANPPDLFINLEVYSYFSCILTGLSRGKIKAGLKKRKSDLRELLYHQSHIFDTSQPVAISYLNAWKDHHHGNTDVILYDFQKHIRTGEGIEQLRQRFPTGADYIVINPNASDLRVERRWPASRFAGLIQKLSSAFGNINFVLTGSRDEQGYVQSIVDLLGNKYSSRVVNAAGLLSIEDLVNMIHYSRLMITNDSGPMHLSFALKKKTIALFGPGHPGQQGIFENELAVYKKVHCSPCVHSHITPPCKGDNICMKNISIEEVFEVASGLLQLHG